MVEAFNEVTMMEVIQEVMNTENLDHLSIEDQMLVLDMIADSIKRYKGKELQKFLDEIDEEYNAKKIRTNLSDL
jgi:hypothetical protein